MLAPGVRSAGAAMLGIFCFKLAVSGFGPPFTELLLERACAPLNQSYVECVAALSACKAASNAAGGHTQSATCASLDAASKLAAVRSSYYSLATSLPGLITVFPHDRFVNPAAIVFSCPSAAGWPPAAHCHVYPRRATTGLVLRDGGGPIRPQVHIGTGLLWGAVPVAGCVVDSSRQDMRGRHRVHR